jgi:hypothetical protein
MRAAFPLAAAPAFLSPCGNRANERAGSRAQLFRLLRAFHAQGEDRAGVLNGVRAMPLTYGTVALSTEIRRSAWSLATVFDRSPWRVMGASRVSGAVCS